MNKLKKIFKNVRVIILIAALVLMIVAIYPNPTNTGVTIRNVMMNSSASLAGIQSPKPTAMPMARERIIAMNNVEIINLQDYNNFINTLEPNRTIHIKTNKALYKLVTKEAFQLIQLNETEEIIVEEIIQVNETINGTTVLVNKTENRTKEVPKIKKISLGMEDLGMSVYDAPTTNIKKGLDLQGGTRVLLQPEEKVEKNEFGLLIESLKQRLNVYGLSDIAVKEAGDLSGNQYILVEIAGATKEEVKDLLSKQGKFEAKIGNETVFRGGNDIVYVARSADQAGIDPYQGCRAISGGYTCRFRFAITLSPEAAQRQADLTKDLEIITENKEEYLSEKLMLYLDDVKVDELNIGADLRGRAVTDIQISGSGVGATPQEATSNTLKNMKKLQTILITGSLPIKLSIKTEKTIPATLGKEFVNNAILMGLLAILAVVVVVFIRYRKIAVAVPMAIICISEVILLLGVASLIKWNLDLAAIAGIILAVGTSVDHQIVISDEILKGETSEIYDWKKRIKKAFFIIMAAYLTTVFAMTPLLFAGAGLLKGFALTTIIGVSLGVFITRPAFAAILEILLKK